VRAAVVLIGLALVLGFGGPAGAVQIDRMEVELVIDPNSESMTAQVRLTLSENTGNQQFESLFLRPTRVDYIREAGSGRSVPYTFQQFSLPEYSNYLCTMNLARLGRECVLELAYAYRGKDFYGYCLNPSTLDNLVLGQLTRPSVYSSHLAWYPFDGGITGRAQIAITVPQGWMGVSAGALQTWESLGTQSRFVYDIPYPSGLLFYPLAAYPYVVTETVYQDRFLLGIYSSSADGRLAREKLQFLTTKVLPFLEELMGDYPLANLRIVEVFPNQGNTGLAARGLVMLSQNLWFAAPIGSSYETPQAVVLVDECAHQWNAYHVKFPNYLAEGISEYTDNLFLERFANPARMATMVTTYREAYTNIVTLIGRLKPFKDQGQTVAQAAQALGLPLSTVEPFWPYAAWNELPITDPRVFPTLYFLKGALAIHALRTQIGDEHFFPGFKKVFAVSTAEPVTLDYYRQCFESVAGRSLKDFFDLWYYGIGLPDN